MEVCHGGVPVRASLRGGHCPSRLVRFDPRRERPMANMGSDIRYAVIRRVDYDALARSGEQVGHVEVEDLVLYQVQDDVERHGEVRTEHLVTVNEVVDGVEEEALRVVASEAIAADRDGRRGHIESDVSRIPAQAQLVAVAASELDH